MFTHTDSMDDTHLHDFLHASNWTPGPAAFIFPLSPTWFMLDTFQGSKALKAPLSVCLKCNSTLSWQHYMASLFHAWRLHRAFQMFSLLLFGVMSCSTLIFLGESWGKWSSSVPIRPCSCFHFPFLNQMEIRPCLKESVSHTTSILHLPVSTFCSPPLGSAQFSPPGFILLIKQSTPSGVLPCPNSSHPTEKELCCLFFFSAAQRKW